MARIIYRPKDIYEQEFKVVMRGFDRTEVDEFLDNVIQDYEHFVAEIERLKTENADLKARIKELEEAENQLAEETSYKQPINLQANRNPSAYGRPIDNSQLNAAASNFDILKRISRLEREVFGKNIEE